MKKITKKNFIKFPNESRNLHLNLFECRRRMLQRHLAELNERNSVRQIVDRS